MYYTRSERTEKKYTVEDAIKAAEIVLAGKVPTCLNPIQAKGYSVHDKLTLVELNDLSEHIVSDSNFYASNKGLS